MSEQAEELVEQLVLAWEPLVTLGVGTAVIDAKVREMIARILSSTSQEDTLVLTKKEVEEARRLRLPCDKFLGWDSDIGKCGESPGPPFCRLCKKLTQFVPQGDSEEKGGEDE